jgi:DNA-binding NarL/FixJ family response regulator
MPEHKRLRVFLIDDHPAMRQGLALLMSQDGLEVCGEAADRAETMAKIDGASPEVVVLDISLGKECGLDLISDIKTFGAKVLCYSMLEDFATIKKALDAGASGYVTKRDLADSLLHGVREIIAGRHYISPGASQVLSSGPQEPDGANAALSQRESQILALVGKGISNTEIAAALNISVRTMEAYCTRIMDKLNIRGMREFRRYAISNAPSQRL